MSSLRSTAVWSNSTSSSAIIAFKSLMHVQFPKWEWADASEKAGLWCLDLTASDIEQVVANYQNCKDPKPKVIFLSREFAVSPVSDWVYFRCPVNPNVLNAWVKANGFDVGADDEKASSGNALPSADTGTWRARAFRLLTWPNTTDYSDSPNIVFACGALMRDWHTEAMIGTLGVDVEVLEKLLDDAEREGNIMYKNVTLDVEINSLFSDLPKNESTQAKSTGMWGRLKGLIGFS